MENDNRILSNECFRCKQKKNESEIKVWGSKKICQECMFAITTYVLEKRTKNQNSEQKKFSEAVNKAIREYIKQHSNLDDFDAFIRVFGWLVDSGIKSGAIITQE